jgi:hypothetical protein
MGREPDMALDKKREVGSRSRGLVVLPLQFLSSPLRTPIAHFNPTPTQIKWLQ